MIVDKKIALVTGASRGIGLAIAKRLMLSNYYVIGTATTEAGVNKINEMLGEAGGSGLLLNVNKNVEMQDTIKDLIINKGKISILVNNAGIVIDKLFLRMNESDWDNVMQTNLKSVFLLCKLVVPGMVSMKFGRIVNISSVSAFIGTPGQTNYSSSKAAMIAFSKSLANELGSRNITVNCVAPGYIETDINSHISEQAKMQYLQSVPLRRCGTPEEVAGVVNFLIGDDASYITGTTIHVNGGMYM